MVLRIFKMIATSRLLTALECKKFVFRPGPHWGSLQRSPDPLAGLRGTNSKEQKEGGRKVRERGRGEERKVRHRPPSQIAGSAPECKAFAVVISISFWQSTIIFIHKTVRRCFLNDDCYSLVLQPCRQALLQIRLLNALVPNVGATYQNWVLGPCDLGNGLFLSIGVLTTTYFIEHKLALKNRPNCRIN